MTRACYRRVAVGTKSHLFPQHASIEITPAQRIENESGEFSCRFSGNPARVARLDRPGRNGPGVMRGTARGPGPRGLFGNRKKRCAAGPMAAQTKPFKATAAAGESGFLCGKRGYSAWRREDEMAVQSH